ncbi:unnamed protein product [Litomosoides sigmodontis]|uniref:Uncharacterized protein n=1 Tax=Litomosoides sigmodontis TaxID=42156 RepID=A0A3P6TB61_LITSI|nr:unnamed protein product [Litomosoides sigmodontis]
MVSARGVLQIPSFITALVGTIINFVALATPAWQHSYCSNLSSLRSRIATVDTERVMDALSNKVYLSIAISILLNSVYEDMNWQHTLLYILLFGQFLTLFAMICFCYSQSADVSRSAQFLFTVTIGFSALINIGCNVAFQIFAHMLEHRFYHVSVSGIYEAYQYRHPREDFFAMRALPELPQKYRKG